MIRWGTRGKLEPKTLVNHSGLIVNKADRLEDVRVVEALLKVKRHLLVDQYRGTKHKVEIWRAKNIDLNTRVRIARRACEFVGRGYPWHRLVFQLVDEKMFGGRMVARRLAIFKRWRICTPLVVEAFWDEGLRFGLEDPDQANPDNLRDFLESEPDKYVLIRELERIT
jgi:hypothetical protein